MARSVVSGHACALQPPKLVFTDNVAAQENILRQAMPGLEFVKEDWAHACSFRFKPTLPSGHPLAK